MLDWEVTDTPQEEDMAIVADGVFTFGRSQTQEGNAQVIACFVRENGTLVAGGTGRTEFNRLFVSQLWVSEPLRRQGLGTKLLVALESRAMERGCTTAMIETLLESAARLYESLGYGIAASVPGYVGPFTRYIMLKQLNTRTPPGDA